MCDNMFCIYWNNGRCILDKIIHNAIGVCTEVIHVNIDEDILIEKRLEILKSFNDNEKG